MSPGPRDPRGEGVEWHADEHHFHLPELATPAHTPATARLLAHRLAVTQVAPENVEEILTAAKACLAEADRAYQQARAERTAIADTAQELAAQRAAIAEAAREVATQRAMVEAATQELVTLRVRMGRDQAALEEARARAAHPSHRSRSRPKPRRPRTAVSDIPGQNLRPDPGTAQHPADLIEVLRRFRTWAGNPSYRDMAQRSGQRIAPSTMWKALRAKDLPPRLEVIDAIVEGCGGSDEDRQRFATAWRRLTMNTPADGAVFLPAPPRLHAVPLPSTDSEPLARAATAEA